MTEVQASPLPAPLALTSAGIRKNGKQWHAAKSAFRPNSNPKSGSTSTSYQKRSVQRLALSATKAKEREMKEEKQNEKDAQIQRIKDRRAAKEEKERYERMAETMHKRRVERVRRREKRNKLLKS